MYRHSAFEYSGLMVIGLLLSAAALQSIILETEAGEVSLVPATYHSKTRDEKKNPFTPQTISVLHVGDMMFDRGVRSAMANGAEPLANFPKAIADFRIGNLEGPVTTHTDCQEKAYSFRFDTTVPAALRAAGVDAVTLANNHSLDCYRQGYDDSKKYLKEAGVLAYGGFSPEESTISATIGNRTVALVGIDATLRAVPLETYKKLIESLKETHDLVLVSIHWGVEYQLKEYATQRQLARGFIDAGADAVFGSHPHVIQPIEIYKRKPIFYSLGNYIFDQTDEDARRGIGGKVTFDQKGAASIDIIPFRIEHATPVFYTNEDKKTACKKVFVYTFERSEDPCHIDL